jgi:hypothetical protein
MIGRIARNRADGALSSTLDLVNGGLESGSVLVGHDEWWLVDEVDLGLQYDE